MNTLKTIITILFVIDCVVLSVLVLLQEGKDHGLGTIGGMGDSYWGQNKGRSVEGALVKITRVLAVLFLLLALVLNMGIFNK